MVGPWADDWPPVPLTLMVVGALLALLATVTAPVSAPAAVGAKVMFMVTLCPAARYRGNESPLALKAGAEELTPESVTVAFPVLLKMTDCEPLPPRGTLPRFKVEGLADITPASLKPVPLSATVDGELVALLISESEPVTLPGL
jgi:hypothetical protein